ncbi:MAG TPA: glycosyltransferase family 1 protein [Anaerolineae bacterium]
MSLICLDARTIQDHFPGIGRYTFNLALALADAAPQEEFVLLHDPAQKNTRFDLAVLRAKPNVRVVETNTPNFSAREQWVIPAALRQMCAGVYHSPYYIMPYRPGVATVVTAHDLLPLHYPQYFSMFERVIFNLTIRLSLRTANKIIAPSRVCADDIHVRLGIDSTRLVVIPEAADPIFRPSSQEQIAALRHRLGLPDSYVLYVGSNKPHKNLVRLVEAFAIADLPSSVSLVVAGPWEARLPQAKQRAAELGLTNVRWLDEVARADLPALYSGATLFVFPSEYEGFGLPPLEAMACGAPVLSSNAASLREVGGESARYFDPHDVNALANEMKSILTDAGLREYMKAQSLRQAAKFSWFDAARATYQVYQSARRAT